MREVGMIEPLVTAKTYTDAMSLPLFGELEKLTALPSLPASLNCEKEGSNASVPVQMGAPEKTVKNVINGSNGAGLTELVPHLENLKLAERGGFEPPTALGCSRFPGVRVKPLCHLSTTSLSVIVGANPHAGKLISYGRGSLLQLLQESNLIYGPLP